MSRSKWKGPFINKNIITNCINKKEKKLKIVTRSTEIIPNFVGLTFNIPNGKIFKKITVNENMIGHKFGEFSQTRKKFSFKKTK